MVAFGEVVPGRKSGVPDNRLSSAWSTGIWLGRATETNEHIVGTTTGVIRCRTIKRRPDDLQWEGSFRVDGVPAVVAERFEGCSGGGIVDSDGWLPGMRGRPGHSAKGRKAKEAHAGVHAEAG